MAVVSIKELSGKSGSVNSSFQRNYTRTWVVVTDNAADGPFVIGSTAGLPLIYDPYPEDVRAFCVSLNVSQDGDNPQVFRVEAAYAYNIDASFGTGSPIPISTGNPLVDSQQKGQAPQDRKADPLLRPRDYSYSTTSSGEKQILSKDFSATPKKIVNTADCPLNPPLYVDVPALTLTIGLNAVTGPSAAWAESVGCLNANQIVVGGYTIAKDHAMLRAVSANSVFEEGQKYWRWQIVFEIRPDWDHVSDSSGLMAYQYEKNATGNKVKSDKPKPIKRNNSTITQPVLLDIGGFEASTIADAATLRFKIRDSKVFPTPL
jgi:hypothetical protein